MSEEEYYMEEKPMRIQRFDDARDRFFELRFGMFVHWGLYAVPGWHEQLLWRGDTTREHYEALMHEFNPVRFDPEAWLDLAEAAGMQYVCFTTKHHDGFCMWDTKQTDYNIMHTPYGKDIVGQLAEACHRRGFPISFYYSCPDWHHPNYPNQGRHHELFAPRATDEPDLDRYYAFVKAQIGELLTGYGPIYQLFWDVNVAEYYNDELNAYARSLQPGLLINNRGPDAGDYSTPERELPGGAAFTTPTEACQSLGRESWGFRADEDYYSRKFLMQSIDQILAMGGNYLLNVGPRADGTIDEANVETLRRIGDWYSKVREAFDGAYPATYLKSDDRDQVLLTRKGNAIYVHAPHDLQTTSVTLKPLDRLPARAVLLNDGRELPVRVELLPWYWQEKPYLQVQQIPVDDYPGEVLVIRLEFDA